MSEESESSPARVVEQVGGLDAAFLYCETPGMHMHVCGLLVLDPSTMDADPYGRIRSMLLGALPKVPLMRKRLATVPLGISRPYWIDDVDFDIDRHLHRVHLAPPGDDRSLARIAGDVASKPLRRDRPLWEVWFLEGLAEGQVALLAKMHHATIDGVSGVSVMGRLFDFDAPQPGPSGPADSWQPGRTPSPLELLGRGLLDRLTAPLEVARLLPVTVGRLGVTLWSAVSRGSRGNATVKPFTAPRTSFNATLTERRAIAFTDVPLADFKMVKDAFDVKINDVLTAVVGGALRRYLAGRGELPGRPLIAAEPVSVHGRSGGMTGVTKLSVIFATLATDVEDPVERLRTVAAANVRAKEVSQTMGADTFTRWSEQFWPNALSIGARLYSNLHLADRHGVVFNLLLSNVAGPPFALYLAGGHVVGIYAFGPITDGAGLNVTVISTGDQVGFGIVACPDLMPGVWDLADAIPGALDELTAAAKRRPPGTSRRARHSSTT
jgi:WS/DGAT/MGAT family acyltransferase